MWPTKTATRLTGRGPGGATREAPGSGTPPRVCVRLTGMRTDSPEAADSPAGEPDEATWCEVAPWLESRNDDPDFFWIDDDPATAEPEVQRAHCDLIAVLITETLPEIPLGDLLPRLPGGVDLIPDPELPTRAANWLLQSSTFTTDRIRPVTAADILDSRGMGTGSVIPLLSRLVRLSIRAIAGESAGDRRSEATRAVLDDLAAVARWRLVTGDGDTPLLDALPAYAPPAVRDARRRLGALTAASPALAGAGPSSVAQQLSLRLDDLAERDLEVFVARRLTPERTRLETLGERFGVSRERVRQYEARALDDLYTWLENNADAQFVIAAATAIITTVRPLHDVVAALPVIGEQVPAVGRPLWRVLTGIGVPFEIDDGWAAAPTVDAARSATGALIAESADEFGVVDPADLAGLTLAGLPDETPGWRQAWAAAAGFVVYRDRVLARTTTVEDYAAAVLSVHGEPMTPEELVGRFHVDRSARTVVNQMIGDDRFQRVSRTQWGLRVWGRPAYETIRTAIGNLLDELGGSAPLDWLAEQLSAAFDVKPASVVAYAAATPFRTDDGVVTRTDQPPQPRKTPAQTRQLYRVGEHWKLRVTVNREHLRGSGSPLPVALATVLDLSYGEVRRLDSPDGEQVVSWTALQPTLGSTRRFLSALGAGANAEVFFVFSDDGRFDVETVRSEPEVMSDVLAQIGAAPTGDPAVALRTLAVAVGLGADSPLAVVREAFTARGEHELAARLTAPQG